MAAENTCLTRLVSLLETYRGRDKVIRLINYAAYIANGLLERYRGKGNDLKIGKIAAELSNLRVMSRLIDDLAMLQFSLSYGTGAQEKDPVCRTLQLFQNSVDQLYYPVEHIAWARDVGILSGKSEKLWSFGCFLWVISLLLGILSSIRKLLMNRWRQKHENSSMYERREYSSETENGSSTHEKSRCFAKENMSLLIGLCGNFADLVNGIHWLPPGYLWASKLPIEAVGLFGTISSVCLLYNAINPQ